MRAEKKAKKFMWLNSNWDIEHKKQQRWWISVFATVSSII